MSYYRASDELFFNFHQKLSVFNLLADLKFNCITYFRLQALITSKPLRHMRGIGEDKMQSIAPHASLDIKISFGIIGPHFITYASPTAEEVKCKPNGVAYSFYRKPLHECFNRAYHGHQFNYSTFVIIVPAQA